MQLRRYPLNYRYEGFPILFMMPQAACSEFIAFLLSEQTFLTAIFAARGLNVG